MRGKEKGREEKNKCKEKSLKGTTVERTTLLCFPPLPIKGLYQKQFISQNCHFNKTHNLGCAAFEENYNYFIHEFSGGKKILSFSV